MLDNPINAYLRAAEMKNQNRRQAMQDAQGIGQNFGEGFNTIGQAMKEQQRKAILNQIVTSMQNQGKPIQGPVGYVPPGAPPNAVPAGQVPDMNTKIDSLMTKYDPEMGMKMLLQQDKASPWHIVPNMLSKAGRPIQENKITGLTREAPLDATPTGRGNSSFGVGSVNWDNATQEDRDTAKGLYEGRIRAFDLSPRERGIGVRLANEYAIKNGLSPYKSYAGNVAGKSAEAFASGKLGGNALSLNTALGHVDSAYDAYQKLGNMDQKWLNRPLNALKRETNDPNVVRLGVTLNALKGEMANVFKGSGGTDQEIASWSKYLTDDLTPTQINAVIPQIDELLRSRLSALDYQRKSGMSGRNEMPLLSPKGAQISKKFGGGNPGASKQKEAPTATGPNGQKIKWNGSAWVPL